MENPPWRYSVNALVSIINPGSSVECPFCFQRETVFHIFLYCSKLDLLFQVLTGLFNRFDETFSPDVFICVFKYIRKHCFCC